MSHIFMAIIALEEFSCFTAYHIAWNTTLPGHWATFVDPSGMLGDKEFELDNDCSEINLNWMIYTEELAICRLFYK